MEQKTRLHYHDFCVGHGFLKEIAKSERCDCCGDTDADHLFSFDNKEEFADKYVYNQIGWLYQNDEWTLTKEEVFNEAGYVGDRLEDARELYDELIQRVY